MVSKNEAATVEHAGVTVTVAPYRTPRMALNLSMTSYKLRDAIRAAVPQLYEGLPEPDMSQDYEGDDDQVLKARIAYNKLDNELADYMTAAIWVVDASELDFAFPQPMDDTETVTDKILAFVDSPQAGICSKVRAVVEARETPDPKATPSETKTS